MTTLHEKLDELAEECSERDWDGYDASPVLSEVVKTAHEFLSQIPKIWPIPELGAEPDGCITIEWYITNKKEISVSVGKDRILSYSYIVDGKSESGKVEMDSNIPDVIVGLIRYVVHSCKI